VQYDRTVIGYHGCEAETAERILAGEPFKQSQNEHDWLGHGIYFWEYGLDRAWRWAQKRCEELGTTPAVVGALIQLGNCFDLLDTRATAELVEWATLFAKIAREQGLSLPRNVGATPDLGGRRLDCAIVNYALDQLREDGSLYDTVRCGFVEGDPIYADHEGRKTEIRRESHIQIVVRNPVCIIGTFRPVPTGTVP
jgi:hypothetical protein